MLLCVTECLSTEYRMLISVCPIDGTLGWSSRLVIFMVDNFDGCICTCITADACQDIG